MSELTEAQCAVMREALSEIAKETGTPYARIAQKALDSTDTGAALAAWLEKVRGMPCHGEATIAGACSEALPRAKDLWCLRCQCWGAMGWK